MQVNEPKTVLLLSVTDAWTTTTCTHQFMRELMFTDASDCSEHYLTCITYPKNCSGLSQEIWQIAQSIGLAWKVPRSSLDQASVEPSPICHWSDLTHQGMDAKPPKTVLWFAVNPLISVGCMGIPWIRISQAHPMGARSDWHLGNLEAMSMAWVLCHVPRANPEHFYYVAGHIVLLGVNAIGECCCHEEEVYLVCNGVWVGGMWQDRNLGSWPSCGSQFYQAFVGHAQQSLINGNPSVD